MSVTANNMTQGPGTLYTGALGATEPSDTAVNTTPAASAWTDMGGTDGGVKFSVDQKYAVLACDQIVDEVGRRLTGRVTSFDTSLAEPTLVNLQQAINGGTMASGAGFATLDPVNATSATQPLYFAAILDGWAPGGAFRRRIIGRRCLNTSKVDSMYTKDKQTYIPVVLNLHYVSSSIPTFHIQDQTS